jgi:hypothetical protein
MRVRLPAVVGEFSPHHNVHYASETHSAFYEMDTGDTFSDDIAVVT